MADDAAAPEGELSKSTPTDATSSAAEPESTAIEATDVTEATETTETTEAADAAPDEGPDEALEEAPEEDQPAAKTPMSPLRLATIVGLVSVLALGGLTGWLGYRAYQSHQAEQQRNLFVQVARQGALNLTTIGWEQAEADVQRILDSATGNFYDDFQRRAQPFVEVVKQAQSKSTGTVTEAGLESVSDGEAQVLVAVMVETSNAGAPDQAPRAWRMRLTVQQVDDEAKVANVEFVP